ncbi:MAG: heme ABC transporter ATP-binding protein [Spirochaetia bacterium]|nr:heme ABC transporter ATP-binding protein [Spirochaetia bacterium]
MSLSAENVTIRRGGRRILDDATLQVNPGEFCVVLGRNGAGKSTLLSILAGDITPDQGRVVLDGDSLSSIPPIDVARKRGVLLQESGLQFPFSVEEVVRLGRAPHKRETDEEEDRIIDSVLSLCGVQDKRSMVFQKLSGGEKQRVQLARVIAQIQTSQSDRSDTRYLLLDEPVSALDLYHQTRILETVRDMAHNGCGILAILHDVNLAAQYADRIVFLSAGKVHSEGGASMLSPALVEEIYGVRMHGFKDPGTGKSFYMPYVHESNESREVKMN